MKKLLIVILILVALYRHFGEALSWDEWEFDSGEAAAESAEAEDALAGHTYAVVADDVTWEQAKERAEEQGGYLATITTQTEWEKVQTLADASGLKYLWLGGQADSEERNFSWITGESFDLTYWYEGEPSGTDSSDGTEEPYLCMWNIDGTWTWNDQRNDIIAGNQAAAGLIGYVIEYE